MNTTLQSLNPTAALLILKGNEASLSEMLKLTFFDLVHRNILQVTEEEIVNRQPEPPTKVLFVQLGSVGAGYVPLAHEDAILRFFVGNPQAKILFQTVVKLAMRDAGRRSQYCRRVIRERQHALFFREGLLQLIFTGFGLTDQGVTLRSRLEKDLRDQGLRIAELQGRDANAAGRMIRSLGAFALLVPGLDLSQLPLAKEGFAKESDPEHVTSRESSTSYISSGCSSTGCSSWDSWSSMSATFDHGGHSHSHGGGHGWGSDGDSGCGGDSGGDSGCGGSGCSGCGGGCGGCGS